MQIALLQPQTPHSSITNIPHCPVQSINRSPPHTPAQSSSFTSVVSPEHQLSHPIGSIQLLSSYFASGL